MTINILWLSHDHYIHDCHMTITWSWVVSCAQVNYLSLFTHCIIAITLSLQDLTMFVNRISELVKNTLQQLASLHSPHAYVLTSVNSHNYIYTCVYGCIILVYISLCLILKAQSRKNKAWIMYTLHIHILWWFITCVIHVHVQYIYTCNLEHCVSWVCISWMGWPCLHLSNRTLNVMNANGIHLLVSFYLNVHCYTFSQCSTCA